MKTVSMLSIDMYTSCSAIIVNIYGKYNLVQNFEGAV